MEEKIRRLLESKNPEDQLVAIELIKSNRSLKLEFIPWQSLDSDVEKNKNNSGIEGYIQMKGYKFLVGGHTYRRVSRNSDFCQRNLYVELT
jgi:hypothetical protein